MREITFYDLSEFTATAVGKINKIYLHWTGYDYDTPFTDYHINITGDCKIFTDITHAKKGFNEVKPHTYMRNTNAIGITVCCAKEAKPVYKTGKWVAKFGNYPPKTEQLDLMAKIIAKICVEINLDINNRTIMTHDEAARNTDGRKSHENYGVGSGDPQTKWDLIGLGDKIRAEAISYKHSWRY